MNLPSGRGHTTRTLLLSRKTPGLLVVSRGSDGNIDDATRDVTSGISQIRVFNISGTGTVKYTDGEVLGWGLRNSVGLAEHPKDGGIWSNENASDNMGREGGDIHEESPGEEVNYHGTLADKSTWGKNYGYPDCAAVWHVEKIPSNSKLKVGMQFTHNGTKEGITDEMCGDFVGPRLTLPSHWAPLDIAFNQRGDVAYMTSHGSWNKDKADGYQVFAIPFGADGQPTPPASSTNGWAPILTAQNMRVCKKKGDEPAPKCFRPVGLAFDTKGRLFMSSDSTGEIYVIDREGGGSVDELAVEEIEKLRVK